MDFVQQRNETVEQELTSAPSDPCLAPVAGIQAITTIDFPGRLSAVFFLRGCPWFCRYCHNPSLRNDDVGENATQSHVEEFLRERSGFLEGIVVSGGEPTCHKELPAFLEWVRSFGYDIALHTNGFFPGMLRRVLAKKLVDYIAMDIKAPPKAYDRVTGVENSCIAVSRSIEIILSSGIDCEFRTTYHPDILSEEELREIVRVMSAIGVKRYFIQRFRSHGVADEELSRTCDVVQIPDVIAKEARHLFETFEVR